jgi:hypothetical protein
MRRVTAVSYVQFAVLRLHMFPNEQTKRVVSSWMIAKSNLRFALHLSTRHDSASSKRRSRLFRLATESSAHFDLAIFNLAD